MISPLRFGVIGTTKTPEIEDLCALAKERGIFLDHINVETPLQNIGSYDLLYWRSSRVTKQFKRGAGRSFFLKNQKLGTVVVNDSIIDNPLIVHKSYQQSHMAFSQNTVKTIDTYLANTTDELLTLVSQGLLTYPIISKPDQGSQGVGIELLLNESKVREIGRAHV